MKTSLWILNLSVPSSAGEAVGDALGTDALAISVTAPPRRKDAHIEVIYGQRPKKAEISVKLALISAALGMSAPKFTIKPSPKLDWLKKVASDFPPIDIGRWTVYGALHKKKVKDRSMALQIDATSAFGTGEHPTTKGCLILLDEFLNKGFAPRKMADIGCGSGILAMACSKATKCKAVGVDIDKPSVKIAKGNATKNRLAQRVSFVCGDGYKSYALRKSAPYDLIMANIFAGPLCEMAKDLKKNLSPKGIAILSGLLNTQADAVIAAHEKLNLKVIKRKKLGEWTALALAHKDMEK